MKPEGCGAATPQITAIAAQIIDWSTATVFNFIFPNAGIVFAPVFANVTVGQQIIIVTTQGTTASTNNWNSTGMTTIKFSGGTKTLTAAANAVDQFTLTCVTAGVVYGFASQAMA